MAVLAPLSPPRFVALWAGCLLAALALAAGANWAIDPYGVFGTRLPGLSADKPAAIDQPFVSKVYLLERAHPRTIVIGSSRADIGFDPRSPAWPEAMRPVFNLGMPGAALRTQALFLRHAFAVAQPKLVLIVLAFDDTLVDPADARKPADRSRGTDRLVVARGGGPNPRAWKARWDDRVTALLSVSALGESLDTVLDPAGRSAMTPLGFNTGKDFVAAVRAEGQHALYVDKDRDKLAELLPWSRTQAFDVAPLGDMLATAAAHGARSVVVIPPEPADDLAIYRALGAAPTLARWRAEVTRIVAAAGSDAVLWDFSGPSAYTAEPVPPPSARTPQRWFWETNHFRPALGAAMLERMFGGGDPAFGTVLDEANLPEVQARRDAEWAGFATAHADAAARIDPLAAAARRRACRADAAFCDTATP